jgi:3-hydroxybutyryl-CoA dehydrogenase
VNEGVATVRDVDLAVSAGPGIRWAAMGPTMLFHLGGDDGGLAAFCERYAESFNRWWDDLGTPHLDRATAERLIAGLPSTDLGGLAERRDALIASIIAATQRS